MKAIVTTYHGPGAVKGSRISATDNDGNRVILDRDCALSVEQAHDTAARALCQKMKWSGELVRGTMLQSGRTKGNVYVWLTPSEIVKV